MKRYLVRTIDGKHIIKAKYCCAEENGTNLIFYNELDDERECEVAWFTTWKYFKEIPYETWWERLINKLWSGS